MLSFSGARDNLQSDLTQDFTTPILSTSLIAARYFARRVILVFLSFSVFVTRDSGTFQARYSEQ